MPSASLFRWRNDRVPRLAEVDAQCSASVALSPTNPELVEENLRGYVLLLSAHFQGFCRDLYTECSQLVVARIRRSLQSVVQHQFRAHRRIDQGNPNLQNLKEDFRRFGVDLDLPAIDPVNAARLTDLALLNRWRNIAAHHSTVPLGSALNLILIQSWRRACDGLASSLDRIMYNQMRKMLRRQPWPP